SLWRVLLPHTAAREPPHVTDTLYRSQGRFCQLHTAPSEKPNLWDLGEPPAAVCSCPRFYSSLVPAAQSAHVSRQNLRQRNTFPWAGVPDGRRKPNDARPHQGSDHTGCQLW